MKASVTYMAIGWLVYGASDCFADSMRSPLLGEWAKVVKVDAHQSTAQGTRTQFDSSDLAFIFTKQEGGLIKGAKALKGRQEAISCEVGGDNRTLVCEDAGGIFEGKMYGSDEIVGTYRAGGDSSTISTLILRGCRQK